MCSNKSSVVIQIVHPHLLKMGHTYGAYFISADCTATDMTMVLMRMVTLGVFGPLFGQWRGSLAAHPATNCYSIGRPLWFNRTFGSVAISRLGFWY